MLYSIAPRRKTPHRGICPERCANGPCDACPVWIDHALANRGRKRVHAARISLVAEDRRLRQGDDNPCAAAINSNFGNEVSRFFTAPAPRKLPYRSKSSS